MRVEIWLGNTGYIIKDVKRIEASVDGAFVKITDSEGYTYETSPQNILILSEPNERR